MTAPRRRWSFPMVLTTESWAFLVVFGAIAAVALVPGATTRRVAVVIAGMLVAAELLLTAARIARAPINGRWSLWPLRAKALLMFAIVSGILSALLLADIIWGILES